MKIKTAALFLCIVIGILSFMGKTPLNNACTNYSSYFNMYFSSECYYIPDNYDEVPEIIKRHIGLQETHQVITEDGYLLTLFRLPREHPKDVMFLQHGIASDSSLWMAQHNRSIALFFWKAGYDVWLGNSRGTYYSEKHLNLSNEEEEFWNYTFHELGYYDVDASINYVKKVSNVSKIIYVGHSLGVTSSLVYASLRAEEAANSLKVVVQMAPMSHGKYYTSPIRYLSTIDAVMDYNQQKLIKWYSFAEHNSWYFTLIRGLNRYLPFKKVTAYYLSFLLGWTPDELDPNYVNLVTDKIGSAFSWKTYKHCLQVSYVGRFQMYDYGKEDNLKVYGREEPPLYPLKNFKVPTYIIHSKDDTLSSFRDVEYLYELLPEEVKIYGKLEIEGINHIDFFFGRHREEKIYSKILDFIDRNIS